MIACLVALAIALQEEPEPVKPAKPKPVKKAADEWTASPAVRLDVAYNSNIWQLDGEDQDRLLADQPGDQISGRYDDLESIEDWIFTPSVRLGAKGPSPFGGKLEAYAELEWQQYAVNTARSHLRARLGAEQKVGANGRLGLDVEFIPDYFHENRLSDATDFTGSVSSSERVYKAAHYRQIEASLSYRHTLVESDDFSLDGVAAVGLRLRNSTFDSRDEFAPPVEIGLRARSWKRVKWKLAFQLEQIDSPGEREVLLRDEPFFGTDLNGDGDLIDVDARAFETVDRSRRETSVIAGVEVEVIEAVSIGLEWKRTRKDWSSGELYDTSHRDRTDTHDEIELTAKVRLSREWEVRFQYEYTLQESNRDADPSGESHDYKRNIFVLSVIFRG